MNPRLVEFLQKTSLYSFAKYYEHIDPKWHMYFYELHFKHENDLVRHYWMLREKNPNMDIE